MGCSSYCEFTVILRNEEKIQWVGEDGFSPIFFIPDQAESLLKEIHSVEDLVGFVKECVAADGLDMEEAEGIYQRKCRSFDEQLRSIACFEDVDSLAFSWATYYPENGAPDADTCNGESLSYDFTTGETKLSEIADKEFVALMEDIYGSLFD